MEEIWRDIPRYEGYYQASNLGRIRRKKTGKVLNTNTSNRGYLRICLCKKGKKKFYSIHRLVWEAFNGTIPEGMQINHINEDKTDNRLENLNLMTCRENINWGTGIERRKEKITNNSSSKKVYQYDLNGNFIAEFPSTKEVERQLGFSNNHISDVCRKKQKTAYNYIWKYEREVA